MDVTDIVDYNLTTLNSNHRNESFFILSKDDPAIGFQFDASVCAGNVYPRPDGCNTSADETSSLHLRLRLASHLASYIRGQMEEQKRFTSTVGISTSKLLSKLVGNLNKPRAQTTLLPPYKNSHDQTGNVLNFIDGYEIGKIPNIGYRSARKIREYVLQRDASFKEEVIYGKPKDEVLVCQVRTSPKMDAERLEIILQGPGSHHGIGFKIWCLIHGVDESEVALARALPRQISIEDSYLGVNSIEELKYQMKSLAKNLIKRMHLDLVVTDVEESNRALQKPRCESLGSKTQSDSLRRWLAHPKTLRLATRLKRVQNPDGSRTRSFNRSSRSTAVPNFLFDLNEPIDILTERLVVESLLPLFRKLHPEKSGWNLTIINVAVTGMVETAGDAKAAVGRDIGKMIMKQQRKDTHAGSKEENGTFSRSDSPNYSNIEKDNELPEDSCQTVPIGQPATAPADNSKVSNLSGWEADEEQWDQNDETAVYTCRLCGACLPEFAIDAHQEFHLVGG